jgi:hypothetical protein
LIWNPSLWGGQSLFALDELETGSALVEEYSNSKAAISNQPSKHQATFDLSFDLKERRDSAEVFSPIRSSIRLREPWQQYSTQKKFNRVQKI